MSSSKQPKPPKQTAEERANLALQTQLLQMQRGQIESASRQQNLLAPYFYKQLGLTPRYGPAARNVQTKDNFDAARYLAENPDVAASKDFKDDPWKHWTRSEERRVGKECR